MLTHLTTAEWLRGLALTAGQILLALAVLRGAYLVIRFGAKHKQP